MRLSGFFDLCGKKQADYGWLILAPRGAAVGSLKIVDREDWCFCLVVSDLNVHLRAEMHLLRVFLSGGLQIPSVMFICWWFCAAGGARPC